MAPLPTGTVTFLFTDIESSTALWERNPEQMRRALHVHDELMHRVIESCGGGVFKTMGDAFYAVFPTASAALVAAITAQDTIKAESWPASAELRVRMALHTGAAEERGGDYFGPPLNRLARLLTLAQGGQVLLSQATSILVRDALPEGVDLRDLGERQLKDLARPERVFEMVTVPAVAPERPRAEGHSRPKLEPEAGRSAPGQRPSELQVHLLGRFQVVRQGTILSEDVWRRRKARQLLKYLLTRPQRRVSKDEAVEVLWPDSDAESGAVNLRTTVFALRRALSPPGDDARDLVVVDRDTISLRRDAEIWVDADVFEETIRKARRGPDSASLLAEANVLYSGEYLPDDLYEEWSIERRDVLKRLWKELQYALAHEAEKRGDLETAVTALERLLGADPCDEHAARELMQQYIRLGRRSDALRVYQRLFDSLARELEVGPSPETMELRRKLAAGELQEQSQGLVSVAPPVLPVCSYPFPIPGRLVGRTAELAVLDQLLQRGRASGQMLLLGAPVGTGKSTLVGELVRRAQEAGVLCLAGGCYEQEGVVPLGPFQDALASYLAGQPVERLRHELGSIAADLARMVPELRYRLDLPEVASADSGAERVRLFGAVHAFLRRLAERGPVLLCLEDLHATDAASLQLLHYLARQTRALPLVMVGTFRTEEVTPGQPLAQLMASMARERLADQLTLTPLDRDDTSRLAAALLDGPASERLNESLYTTTEGNPLFLEQLVLALREEGRLDLRSGIWQQSGTSGYSIPKVIREVIGRRVERLSASCRETLAVAAVIGQTARQDILMACREPSDESRLLTDLEEAITVQLLVEASGCYAFGHALVRDTIYWSLSAPRRMLLHGRVADSLEKLAGSRVSDQAAELAHHFGLAAGTGLQRAKALEYSLQAGRQASTLSAHEEALAHFSRACVLIELLGDQVDIGARLAALEGRGYAERELAMWQASIASFREVLRCTEDPIRRAWARAAIGYALHHTVDIAAALAECDAGLAELGALEENSQTVVARLRLQTSKALPLFLQGRFEHMLALGNEMVRVAISLDEPRPLTWAHNTLGLACMGQGQVQAALEQFKLSLEAAQRNDDKVSMAIAHENIGHQQYRAGRFDEARAELGQAIALYRDSAAESRAVLALQALGRLWLAEGNLEQAREQAELGLGLALQAQDRWAADCHDLLGGVQLLLGEWAAAEESFQRAFDIREHVGHAAGMVDSLLGLGLVFQRRGDWSRARDIYARAVSIAAAMDPGPQVVSARRHLGRLLWLMGQDQAATEQIDQAYAVACGISRSFEFASTLLALADLRWRDGQLTEAMDYAETALRAGISAELAVEAHVSLAWLHQLRGSPEAARPHAAEALRLAERVGAPRLLGLGYLADARVSALAGQHAAARKSFQTAINHLESGRTPYEQALALRDYAQELSSHGEREHAIELLSRAIVTFEQLGAAPAASRAQSILQDPEAGARSGAGAIPRQV